ncbi:MAG: TlyA family RNA methyltransferase [Parvularculaceae bacterium]|nr:TlyA family RNA methyltransferase [Parvularculaceae bacterium]
MSMNSFHARTARSKKPAVRPVVAHHGTRADALLVQRGLAPSRTAAQRLIEAGRVSLDGEAILKPAQLLPENVVLAVAPAPDAEYVSRGGIKLAGALAHTGIDVRGRNCLDIGQSTGGFTDCLLQQGAAHVVGIDVGHGQLHPSLAADPRIEPHEGINARQLQKSALAGRRFDLIVADVSFISLTLIIPQLPPLLAGLGDLLLLVKPQFEVGPENVGKGGIVADPRLYSAVRDKLVACCAEHRLAVRDWFDSPITGTDGNREFFLHARHDH